MRKTTGGRIDPHGNQPSKKLAAFVFYSLVSSGAITVMRTGVGAISERKVKDSGRETTGRTMGNSRISGRGGISVADRMVGSQRRDFERDANETIFPPEITTGGNKWECLWVKNVSLNSCFSPQQPRERFGSTNSSESFGGGGRQKKFEHKRWV